MDYSRKISERHWNLPDKGERESVRETLYIDDIVQKSHIERALLSNLDGIETVFDGGGGSGRFSILLAKRGLKVTHFDISQPMLDKAREIAEREGVSDHITFVKGALEDLSAFDERTFDLVMSFDAPISYTYPNQETVIRNLVRLARKKVLFSVTSRLGSLPYFADPLQKIKFIMDENSDDPWARAMLDHADAALSRFRFNKDFCFNGLDTGVFGGEQETLDAYDRGEAPWVITYGFLPDELAGILDHCGVKNIRLSGPGAFARTLPREILMKIFGDERQRADFLEFCYAFDSQPSVCGIGKDNLLAAGDI
ncbi:MAG: methyltransferase domain-containing protein [Oscillospiraceae bacterium]